MTITGELLALFRDATVRQRLCLVAILSSFAGTGAWGCSYVGTVMGNMVPVKREVIDRRIVRTEYLAVPRPPRSAYPPLKNPKEACSGAPVIIESLSVAGSQSEKPGSKKVWTYMAVRPAGDDYKVYCDVAGDYSDGFHRGDLVRLFTGEVSG